MKTAGAVLLLLWLGLLAGAAEGGKAELTCLADIDLFQLKEEVRQTKAQLKAIETRLAASEKTAKGSVAFTAALQPPSWDKTGNGHIGPFSTEMTIIHQKVLTNVGQAYDSKTGVFTAPVRGVYFFTFTTYSWVKEANIGVKLMKNSEEVLLVWEWQDKGDNEDFASNSVLLELKVGDRVYMRLPSGYRVAASIWSNIHTFSGFLLYPQ
ncbi:hypothetical protein ACEWY4_006154 [Coilia grayii]|uniref:C1q domain-containing protein n=1 Tax=Coilia grayii TaxID=363190 RepID=A0ABD1KCU6_9TELE